MAVRLLLGMRAEMLLRMVLTGTLLSPDFVSVFKLAMEAQEATAGCAILTERFWTLTSTGSTRPRRRQLPCDTLEYATLLRGSREVAWYDSKPDILLLSLSMKDDSGTPLEWRAL